MHGKRDTLKVLKAEGLPWSDLENKASKIEMTGKPLSVAYALEEGP